MLTSIPARTHPSPVRFEDIFERLAELYSEDDLKLVRRAYVFSAQAHRGQERLSGEPYLSHPLAVAMILTQMRLDPVSVAVGLLHDVLEDTDVDRNQLVSVLGEEVATLVEGVTKIGQLEFSSKLEQQAGNFRKLLVAMVEDIRVLLIKLGDRLHNMRTLEHLPVRSRRRIARETQEIYAPLAHRLGMGRLHEELQDLALFNLEPDAYKRLSLQIQRRLKTVKSFTRRIEVRIAKAIREHDVPCQVEHRVKSLSSVHEKMSRRDLTLDEVYDLVAFRVCTDGVRNCYAVLGIIHNLWRPVPGRFKDYIAMPKPNMYQSLHTALIDSGQTFEVQIRTEDMHSVAEEGIAAHWLYKERAAYSAIDEQPLQWLRQLVEWQREVSDPREFLSSLKLDLYPDEVHVFTPKGEVKTLPRGATSIDFAYAIHTEIGEHCQGARVNGKLTPIRKPLQNGDIVEISTSVDSSPSRDWLRVVTTPRARNKIRTHLNRRERESSIELGKRVCEKEFRRFGLRLGRLVADGTLDELAGTLGLAKGDDLLAAIGYGKTSPRVVVEKVLPPDRLNQELEPPGALRRAFDSALRRSGEPVVQVKGMDDVLVYRARCCGALPGEQIVGYVTRGKGVSVHAADCPNVERLLPNEERSIPVVWRTSKDDVQPVRLDVNVQDRRGLLAAITTKIADRDTNIRGIESHIDEVGQGTIELIVDVTDVQHLRQITQLLAGLRGVRGVRRGRVPNYQNATYDRANTPEA